ncbi:family 1 glycosylhydrolase [Sphingomonas sp.]|uniref:family 1 glycosylhydrolase n=1 Tax=Sphingomonas sp. TaxID=28214 RepID=UPI0026281803|nr:family 1 glycosylhydrolase [Sphingomonas sp.]
MGNGWRDQLRASGHDTRPGDVELIAQLGMSAVRYPILWERISPDHPDEGDWSWTDDRLSQLHGHGVRVIGGLVHHGSGPRYTDLTQHTFAPGLASHARAAAERYPWIADWTPINEPITTARFSALYGHWYPHTRDERMFWLVLLNQIDATRLAMSEVRVVNSAARLVQTDDLGRTYATASLREQAAFDNMRRWAGWDLLCGKVTQHHPLFERLSRFGLGDRLRAIADSPCQPDVIGVNHYLTSDRFLDHRTELYENEPVGGNGRDQYVDVAAIRVLDPAPQGLAGALSEAWARYRIPLAVTEVHNGCTRDEQMRWMRQAWDIASELAKTGVDIRAVTSWALFGSSGWNTLLTAPGVYEPGVFDANSGVPRATAMASMLPALAAGDRINPVATSRGWWQRDVRFAHAAVPRPAPFAARSPGPCTERQSASILICGATGTLGQALARACGHRNLPFVLTDRRQMSLDSREMIERTLDRYQTWAVINASGWVRVDDAEDQADACFAANTNGAIALAAACDERGVTTITFSSDLVFGGRPGGGYAEDDEPAARNVYGRSKAVAEQAIAMLGGTHLVVRTAAFFSPDDRYNFAWAVADALQRGERFRAASDQIVSPSYVPHLADAVLDLAIDREGGFWHLTSGSAVSWSEFARRIAEACGLPPSLIDAVPGDTLGWRAVRPGNVSLSSRRGSPMPPLDQALAAFARGWRAQLAQQKAS